MMVIQGGKPRNQGHDNFFHKILSEAATLLPTGGQFAITQLCAEFSQGGGTKTRTWQRRK